MKGSEAMTRVAAIAVVGDNRLVPLIMACLADISDRCRYMLLLRPARVVRRWPGRRCFSNRHTAIRGPFNVLFCGSDEFSIGSLEAVLQARDVWKSIRVLTPDVQRVGRGGQRSKKQRGEYKCALISYAEERDLTVSTLSSITSVAVSKQQHESGQARRKPKITWTPPSPFDQHDTDNLLLTASFGHIIPNELLHSFNPAHRLNVHPSLLPKYRGAAPLQWTILNGETTTGISVQRLVERGKGIDAGEIVGSLSDIAVKPDATFPSLMKEFAPLGGEILVRSLREIMAGTDKAVPQDSALQTRAPKVDKETSRIDWHLHSAKQIDRMHRALNYHDPIWTEVSGQPVQLLDVKTLEADSIPETFFSLVQEEEVSSGKAWLDRSSAGKGQRLLVACVPADTSTGSLAIPDGSISWLEVRSVKPEGKKQMGVRDWWNGWPAAERNQGWIQLGAGSRQA